MAIHEIWVAQIVGDTETVTEAFATEWLAYRFIRGNFPNTPDCLTDEDAAKWIQYVENGRFIINRLTVDLPDVPELKMLPDVGTDDLIVNVGRVRSGRLVDGGKIRFELYGTESFIGDADGEVYVLPGTPEVPF